MAAAEALDMIKTGTAPVIIERAQSSALGPVLTPAGETEIPGPVVVAVAPPVITAPIASPEPTIPTVSESEALIPQKEKVIQPAAEPVTQLEIVNVPPDSPMVQEFYNAPAARILGGIPPATSSKSYRLQVGAFTVPRNALNAFDRLKNAGLNPAYEQSGEFYRVVLAGLKANEIQAIAQILANNGFQEAILREETN
jgi:cell division protein FtsN